MGDAPQVHADHVRHLHRRLAGHRRRAAVLRLLVEGRHPRSCAFDKSQVLWAIGLVTALLTAFYMSRQVIMIFFGEAQLGETGRRRAERTAPQPRRPTHDHGDDAHARTSRPWLMTVPLVVLAGARRRAAALINLPFARRLRAPRRSGSSRWSAASEHDARAGRRRTGGVLARRSPTLAGAARHRRWRTLVYQAHRRTSRPVEPAVLRRRPGTSTEAYTAFMGGPGPQAVRRRRRGSTPTSSTARSTASATVVRVAGARARAGCRAGYVRNYALGIGGRRRAAASATFVGEDGF